MLSAQEQFLPAGNILLLPLDQQLEQLTDIVQTIANLSAENEFAFLSTCLILQRFGVIL